MRDHVVGQGVAVGAEERDVQRLLIIPVVTLQTLPTTTPGTTARALDQAQRLRQGGGVTRRSRTNPSGFQQVEADVQMTAEPSEQVVMPLAPIFFIVATRV